MENTTRKWTAVGAVGLFVICTDLTAQATEPPLTIVVHVVNHADVSDTDLWQAESQATRTYKAIGIPLRWVSEGVETESATPVMFHVRMLLLAGEPADRMLAVTRVDDEVLGLAVGPARMAYVFCNRVLGAVSVRGMNFVGVLGRVLAHELGHVLLPSLKAHSDTGIMRASTMVRSDRLEYFTDKQGQLIRLFLRSASQPARRPGWKPTL